MKKKFFANWWLIVLLFVGVTTVCALIFVPIISEARKENAIKQEFWEESSSSEATSQTIKSQEVLNKEGNEQQNTPKLRQQNTEKKEQLNTEKKKQLKTEKRKQRKQKKLEQNNKTAAKAENTTLPKTDQAKSKATAYALDIMSLFSEYDLNAAAADEKYKNLRFSITGTVANINTSSDGKPIIELQGKDSNSIVSCEFPKDAITDIEVLKKGDIIAVKGLCQGFDASIISFKKCRLVR